MFPYFVIGARNDGTFAVIASPGSEEEAEDVVIGDEFEFGYIAQSVQRIG